jgi:hypothetical protein
MGFLNVFFRGISYLLTESKPIRPLLRFDKWTKSDKKAGALYSPAVKTVKQIGVEYEMPARFCAQTGTSCAAGNRELCGRPPKLRSATNKDS